MARSKNISFDTTITVNDEEVEVTVEGTWAAGSPARYYEKNGDPGSPPEDAEIEVRSIIGPDGKIDYDSLSDSDKEDIDAKMYQEGDEPDDFDDFYDEDEFPDI